MILAITALFLHLPAVPQSIVAPPLATIESVGKAAATESAPEPKPAVPKPEDPAANNAALPDAAPALPALDLSFHEFDTSAMPFAPDRTELELPSSDVSLSSAGLPIVPVILSPEPFTATGPARRRFPDHGQSAEWLALSLAQSSTATFDAWSTRRALATGGARESNPLLRPFAGNNSIYAAIQVGPVILDYVGRRMMSSRHSWVRHSWWIPQAAGTAVSLLSGFNNLAVRNAALGH